MALSYHVGSTCLAYRGTQDTGPGGWQPGLTEPLGLQMLAWVTSSSSWPRTSMSGCCQSPSTGNSLFWSDHMLSVPHRRSSHTGAFPDHGGSPSRWHRWPGTSCANCTYLWEVLVSPDI